MNNITISQITDIEDINILRNKSSKYEELTYKYDDECIEMLKNNFQRKDSLYLIAKSGDDFAGFCSIDSNWWEENCFFIREIFIAPNFQKQEIGKKLMQQCIEHAKNHNAVEVVTETAFENVPMQKLCTKLGFIEWDNPQWKEGITYKVKL